jgi:hypothetical protein
MEGQGDFFEAAKWILKYYYFMLYIILLLSGLRGLINILLQKKFIAEHAQLAF